MCRNIQGQAVLFRISGLSHVDNIHGLMSLSGCLALLERRMGETTRWRPLDKPQKNDTVPDNQIGGADIPKKLAGTTED
jgi:hypothetical protein